MWNGQHNKLWTSKCDSACLTLGPITTLGAQNVQITKTSFTPIGQYGMGLAGLLVPNVKGIQWGRDGEP